VLTTDGTWREVDNAGDEWRGAVVPALAASVVLVLAIAVFLLARRVSGALEVSLAPVPLIITAAALVAWASAIRLRLGDRRVTWLSAVVLALFAIACSFPGHRAIDWLVWLTAFAAYGLIPARRSSPAIGADSNSDQLLQQLTRSRAADGCEAVHGRLIAEFAPGERTAVLHVAFCPPFERPPSVEAEVVDGPGCDVKLAQVLHQGARLEARLSRASSAAQRVTIEILATDRPPPATAGR
jgi:hypothetical protein